MVTLRRAEQRQHDRRGKQDIWRTFDPRDREDPLADGFGPLASLNEDHVPPGATVPRHPHHDAEIVTYVRQGTLAYEDSDGRPGLINAGEFHRMSTSRGIRHTENASRRHWAHIFQISLRPARTGLAPRHEQERFSAAQRRGGLCVVASPDARGGSLRVDQDALICSALLDPGQHVVHELSPGRGAWVHIVRGKAALGEVVLATGDGVGVTVGPAVSLTARDDTEVLLLDFGEGTFATSDSEAFR